MKVETRERTIKETVYIANDGTSFSTKAQCEYHEWESQATKVYTLSRRGQRSNRIEIYSTRELAEKASDSEYYTEITEVCLDQRLWDVNEDDIDVQAARKYFFEEEGYMESDVECIKYYRRNYGKE